MAGFNSFSHGRIIVFLRVPKLGKVKTRLAASVGDKLALRLYRAFAEDVLSSAEKTAIPISIHYHPDLPDSPKVLKSWLGSRHEFVPQGGRSLGEKMSHAFARCFRGSTIRAVLVGSDCPSITPEIILSAFGSLGENDLVFGPALDGGYYLAGMGRRFDTFSPFDNIPWGSSRVMEATLNRSRLLGLSTGLVEKISDIDTINDLSSFALNTRIPSGNAEKTKRCLKSDEIQKLF